MNLPERLDRLSPDRRRLLAKRLRRFASASAPEAAGPARLVAFLTPAAGEPTPSADELRRYLAERLPHFMLPSSFVPLDALPTMPNGKVDRRALASRAELPQAGSGSVPEPRRTAADPIEAQLMRIWDDFLDFPDMGRDDNFFELGGHSLLLPPLIDRVRRDFGVELPLGLIFQEPTLKGFAANIRSRNPNRTWRSLTAIRGRGTRPPLYLVHGLGGEIGYYYGLLKYLHPDQPLYGLQAPAEPFSDIESMAAHYLAEIQAHQPRGPYLLGGYCVGGNVAFEMAQHLVDAGESVNLLAIIDSAPPTHLFGDPAPAATMLARRLKRLHTKTPREIFAAVRRRVNSAAQRVVPSRLNKERAKPVEIGDFMDLENMPHAFHEAATRHFRAARDHKPRPFHGDAWLFRSRDDRFSVDIGWGKLVRGTLHVEMISGPHSDVLKEPYIQDAGRKIAAAVDAAVAAGP